MSSKILRNDALSSPWPGIDPFLFCAHHLDHYPPATAEQGVDAATLAQRQLGSDFSGKDGWSMYHGQTVPGFPFHPHRGFETITIVPQGLVDHADSLGATARYGNGDVQWLTAGSGVQHSEMFPLADREKSNPLDLFQIWLNLPARNKMVPPAFTMFWDTTIPRYEYRGENGAVASVKIVAGAFRPVDGDSPAFLPPSPPADSWASQPDSDVAIWQIELAAGASLNLPAASAAARRVLYVHDGGQLRIDGSAIVGNRLVEVRADAILDLHNEGAQTVRTLLLQGVPIAEPVVAHGPFVMNTAAEIQQAMRDYGRTQFGGWPWPTGGPVHAANQARFARQPGQSEDEHPPV